MADLSRIFGFASGSGKGPENNNRASVASSESDSAATVRLEPLNDAASASTSVHKRLPPRPVSPIRIPSPKRTATPAMPPLLSPVRADLSPVKTDSALYSASLPNKPAALHRTRSGIGIFKVPSYLSLRSNSNGSENGGKQAKAGGGGGSSSSTGNGNGNGKGRGSAESSRPPTPMLAGSAEAGPSSSSFKSSRRGIARNASASESSTESANSRNQDGSFSSSLSSGVRLTMPSPPPHTPPSNEAVSAAAVAAAARNKKWANTFVPVAAEETSLFMPNSPPGNFSWHRPSLLQVVEALQVALLSRETAVQGFSTGYTPYPTTTQRSSSPASLTGRRSSYTTTSKVPQSIVPAGHGDAIPGQYRSHIAYLLEGVQMLQDQADQAELRATKAEKAHQEALEQITQLIGEWDAREQRLTQELQQLRDGAGKPGKTWEPGPPESPMRSTVDFASRAKEVMRASESALRKEGHIDAVENRRTSTSALITDLNHDKAISDQYLRIAAAAHRKQRTQGRLAPKPDPLVAVSEAGIAVARQDVVVVDRLHNKDKDHGSGDQEIDGKAPPNKKKAPKRKQKGKGKATFQTGEDPASPPSASTPSTSAQQSYFPGKPSSFSSSSSSSEDYPGTFVPDASHATVPPIPVPGEKGQQQGTV